MTKRKDNSLTLTLTGSDAAMILCRDGTIKLTVPGGDQGQPIPENAVLLMAIAERLETDSEFYDNLLDNMSEAAGQGIAITRGYIH